MLKEGPLGPGLDADLFNIFTNDLENVVYMFVKSADDKVGKH